jgi:hypothetical protein
MAEDKARPVQYASVVQYMRAGLSIPDIFQQWEESMSPMNLEEEAKKALAAETRAVLAFAWSDKDLRKQHLAARKKRQAEESTDA